MRRTYWLRILIVACVLVVIVAQRASAQESVRKEAEASGLTTQAPVPDDIYWDDRFTTRGVSGQVNAIAVSGSNVYVGGNFANADNIVVNRIAKWNGSNWSALGEGVGCGVSYCSPSVYAIAVNGSDVYVGGIFTSAGGIPASSIAVWNGSSWSALGAGVDGAVYAIAVSGNDVFVGGYFTTAGGVSAHSIAKWNALTHTWSGLGAGEGVFGGGYCYQCKSGMISVAAIAVSGSNVYVGGYFTSASGIDVNYIAKFDGVGWSALGSGVSFGSQTYYSPHVSAIAVSGNNVYVAGFFDTAGGVSANNVAVWDGNNWLPLGSGVSAGGYCGSNGVSSIVVSGTSVYVSGTFQAGGINNGIAVWDGINWNAVGGVISNESGCPTVNAIALGGTGLYAGGLFTRAGDTPVNNLARWMSSSWFAVGNSADNGIEGTISAIGVSGNDVYVGGCLSRIGSVSAHNIAKWNT
ncbi:MAG: hypothetical protein HY782_01130, partial [Chloroflexi bacterium]|nr:hypothetical protein [Chloroflexota bacterium]